MKNSWLIALTCALFCLIVPATAEVKVDLGTLGKSLGGWKKRDNQAAEYPLSGSTYRTYKPEISPTPEGGIFVSLRIDHVRGWLSSDDHAVLEITINPQGIISSAKSNIAIQGRSITSDVILGTSEVGKELTGADRAVQIGADLVADLSSKLLREKIVEAGRVSFPAALRHNYNLLYQALVIDGQPVQPLLPVVPPPTQPSPPPAPAQTAPTPTPATTPQTAAPAAEPPTVPGAPPSPPASEPTPPPAKDEAPAAPPPAAEEKPPVAKPVPGNAPLEIKSF
jgi:hypothetical protein